MTYISEPHFVPLKCGVTEDKPHNVFTGTAVGTMLELSSDRASGCAAAVHANYYFLLPSNTEILLPHPSWPLAFLSLEKQVETNVSRSWGKHFGDIFPGLWHCQIWILWG